MDKNIWTNDLNLKEIEDYLKECALNDEFLYLQYQITLLLNDYKEKIKIIDRLNNIINELEKYLKEQKEIWVNDVFDEVFNKLQELKGEDKE